MVSIACDGVSTRSFRPMPIGFAVVISTASLAMRSALSSIQASWATSQPPVLDTPVNERVFVTSPTFADTLNDGVISNVSCSMYDPSLDAKYFHSLTTPTDAVTLDTPFVRTAASTTFCTSDCLSSCDTVVGSFVSGDDQYTWYAGTGASFRSTFFAIALAFAMSEAMRVMRRISFSETIRVHGKHQTSRDFDRRTHRRVT